MLSPPSRPPLPGDSTVEPVTPPAVGTAGGHVASLPVLGFVLATNVSVATLGPNLWYCVSPRGAFLAGVPLGYTSKHKVSTNAKLSS